jgi:catechol 2,3-dioxygenase-like lactoylglutathione lyase family enzyme
MLSRRLAAGRARGIAMIENARTGAQPDGGRMTDDRLQLGRIGQIARPVGDVAVAVRWYTEVLGLPHLYTFGDLAFLDCGGTRLFLSPASTTPVPEPSLLYFAVPDIDAAFDELTARGVTFTHPPKLIHRHDSGIEEWMAFFTDPDGHPLAIMAQRPPS